MQTYNPSLSFADSSTKARLRMLQALLRCPYTGEPIEVRANPIQRRRPMPPLCKGRGTACGGGGVVKTPCVRRRKLLRSGGVGTACGGGRVVKKRHKTASLYRYLQPLSVT